jgi:enoyl-CoA hydratase/carnithine racemase
MVNNFEAIIWEKVEEIGIITLNRPDRFNAVNDQMIQEVCSVVDGLNKDDSVRALIITGAGDKAFCAGADVKKDDKALEWDKDTAPPETFLQGYRGTVIPMMCGLQGLKIPTIAAINGIAVGMGCDLTLSCDLRIACEKTRIASIWIKRGLVPAAGGFWLWPRIVGLGRALDIIFSGRFIEADEGERIGVFNRVVPANSLRSEAIKMAKGYTVNPPIALKLAKMMVYRGLNMDFRTGLELAGAIQTVAHTTEDRNEAINAWREKRQPTFKGR